MHSPLSRAAAVAAAACGVPAGWTRACAESFIPLLPSLLLQAQLHLPALRCVHALFAAAPHLAHVAAGTAEDEQQCLTRRTRRVADCAQLMQAMQPPPVVRSLCDALGQRHGLYALAVLAALLHCYPANAPGSTAEEVGSRRVVAAASAEAHYALCTSGHALCGQVGQQLLAWRSRAVAWLAESPLPALRVLLHCSRAQPALAAALATDAQLLAALWAILPTGGTAAISSCGLGALLLLSPLLSHGCQQPGSVAVQLALPQLTDLISLLAPPDALLERGITSQSTASAESLKGWSAESASTQDAPYWACAAAGAAAACLASLLRADASAQKTVEALTALRGGCNGNPVASVTHWLRLMSTGAMAHVQVALLAAEGWCFAVPATGPADGFASLLHRLLVRLPGKSPLCDSLATSAFWEPVSAMLALGSRLSSGSRALTASGTLALVRAAHDALSKFAFASAVTLERFALGPLIALLQLDELRALRDLPAARGGGARRPRAW